MNKSQSLLSVILFSIIFVIFFHRENIGINLLLFEVAIVLWLLVTKQLQLKGRYTVIAFLGLFSTSIACVVVHSNLAILMNIIWMILMVGLMIEPRVKSLISSATFALLNIYNGQSGFVKAVSRSKLKGKSLGYRLFKLSVYVIPLIIIGIFLTLYSRSNPIFGESLSEFGSIINKLVVDFLRNFDGLIIFTFLLGLIISNFILLRRSNSELLAFDQELREDLTPEKSRPDIGRRNSYLMNEIRSGVFLLIVLNVLILVLNILDIQWVWIDFKWGGQYLKQFVHEGTYLLLISILISIALVVFYFRGALNFIKKSRTLKILSMIWILQNMILAVSVGVRIYWYVEHFSLAYRRIGLIIFLVLVFYGLATVIMKLRRRKTTFYLINKNVVAGLVLLTFASFFNWDSIIARYNFNHANKSFLHLDFMANLSDKSLPFLDVGLDQLEEIDKKQIEIFTFRENYMSIEEYSATIAERKRMFKKEWESKGLLSWNLAEYRAYHSLFPEGME